MNLYLITFQSSLNRIESVYDCHKDLFVEIEKFFTLHLVPYTEAASIPADAYRMAFIASGGVEKMVTQHFELLPYPIHLLTIDGQLKSQIGKGLLVLVGIEDRDTQEDIEWLCKKIANLRIFDDENGVMNRSVTETEGEVMVVSQFTLHASTKKGNRPSYIHASKPDVAIPMYEAFCAEMGLQIGKEVQTGTFGADMKVELVNDGPVTIWIDSQNKE